MFAHPTDPSCVPVLSCVAGLAEIVAMQPLHPNVILKWHEVILISGSMFQSRYLGGLANKESRGIPIEQMTRIAVAAVLFNRILKPWIGSKPR